jgi:hypothetical protein
MTASSLSGDEVGRDPLRVPDDVDDDQWLDRARQLAAARKRLYRVLDACSTCRGARYVEPWPGAVIPHPCPSCNLTDCRELTDSEEAAEDATWD